jgi:hypothetical protein
MMFLHPLVAIADPPIAIPPHMPLIVGAINRWRWERRRIIGSRRSIGRLRRSIIGWIAISTTTAIKAALSCKCR